MLFSSLPVDIIHHILSYNEVVKLRNGKYMGQISPTDERYELLQKIPKMILKDSGMVFTSLGETGYLFDIPLTNKEHSLSLSINQYKSKCHTVSVVYNNRQRGIILRYFRK